MSRETSSALKSRSVRDSPALASPDLLSDVSEMKQDLIKMTAILTTDSADKSSSVDRGSLEKGAEEVPGEPLEIMEKVKEDLAKVSEILRSGTYEGEVAEEAARAARMAEEWLLLSDSEIEEAKKMAPLETQEPVLREARANRGAPRPKAIKDMSGIVSQMSGDLKEYLLDVPEDSTATAQEEVAQEKFTEVILRKSGKRAIPVRVPTQATKTQDSKGSATKALETKGPAGKTKVQETKASAGNVKKPVGRRGKEQGQTDESTESSELLSAPIDSGPVSPVSPVVEETPIGSIKDKVKALQQKVEAEQKEGHKVTSSKPSQLPVMSKSSLKAKESPKTKQHPPKSPKTESDKLEETMSVRELMQAFQTGQDPSKRKSGLFELKTTSPATSEETTKSTSIIKVRTPELSEQEVLLDATLKECPIGNDKQSSPAVRSNLTEITDFQNDDSSDSLKHEGVADSLSASPGDGTPHLSSEDSFKHEGLATPGTSPESLSLSPRNGGQLTKKETGAGTAVMGKSKGKDKSGDSGVGTTDDQPSTDMTFPVSSSEAADDRTTSESISVQKGESKPTKARKLTKRISETVESFLSDEESPDGQLATPLADSPASKLSSHHEGSLELALKQQDSDALSPLADDSLTISHKDSLEGSPVIEDNSSHRTPDSIEPSPTKESPCRDSLESSPVEQKTQPAFPPVLEQPIVSSTHPELSTLPALPPDAVPSRLLRDQEPSADDDSCELTSQMESSAGVHEGSHHTEAAATTARAAAEGPHSVSEQHVSKHKDGIIKIAAVSSGSEGAANITDEQKEESLRKWKGCEGEAVEGKETDLSSLQTSAVKGPCQAETNITDEVKGDHSKHPGVPNAELGAVGQVGETFKPEICIYDDTEDDDEVEPPKTESKGVTAKTGSDPWTTMCDNNVTVTTQVKEEEQKILSLVVDRQSQAATPDTTPGRSPTEESTPTSEPNPFLFQEGKLFEMTRSGAIDMTKRGYEDEGFAFFQIGEQPAEEALSGEVRDDQGGREAIEEVGLNLTLEIKPEVEEIKPEVEEIKPEVEEMKPEVKEKILKEADSQQHCTPTEEDQTGSGAVVPSKPDVSKSRIPRMGISAAAKPTKKDKDQTSPEAIEVKADNSVVEESPLEVDSSPPDPMITNVQTAVTTVTRSVYSEQDRESSDSSPEEQHSVIELTKTTGKARKPASGSERGVKKIPSKASAKFIPQSRVKTASALSTTSPSTTMPKKETHSPESKSRIPIKASPLRPDPSVKRTESQMDKQLKVPVKKDLRRKSETDAGPSVEPKTKTTSSKAKSFCEGESTKPPAKKDQGRPSSADFSTKFKGFQSRLPVRGKPGQPSHTSTPTKEKSEQRKRSVEFFEEISDEAAKLVERLAQAEKEREQEEAMAAISDEESSTLDASIIEKETFPEMQFPPSGDVFPIRPLWDDPVETQMQRLPDDKVRSQVDPQDEAERKEERLAIIADHLGFSWTELARELAFSEESINLVRVENPNSLQDQSHALLKLWTEREGKDATETALIKKLTKINRMDIVHLIETKITKSTQEETSSHTYAEIERTITLEHSEGFSALHDDIDSPRPGRRSGATPTRGPASGQQPPMVSEEDLSSSLFSLQETPERAEIDASVTGHLRQAQKGKLQKELEATHTAQSWFEKAGAESVHMGMLKRADELPDIPPQTVTEETYTDEQGNLVVKKITRKVIRQYGSPDGVERREVTVEGSPQEMVRVEEGDAVSRVVKRTVIRSEGDQTEVTFSEPQALGAAAASEFETEAVQGRRVSRVVKTMVVRGERTEKQTGDPSLAGDLPSAREDFEKSPDA